MGRALSRRPMGQRIRTRCLSCKPSLFGRESTTSSATDAVSMRRAWRCLCNASKRLTSHEHEPRLRETSSTARKPTSTIFGTCSSGATTSSEAAVLVYTASAVHYGRDSESSDEAASAEVASPSSRLSVPAAKGGGSGWGVSETSLGSSGSFGAGARQGLRSWTISR